MQEKESTVSGGNEAGGKAEELGAVAPPCAVSPSPKQTPQGKRKKLADAAAADAGDGLATGKKVRGGGAMPASQESKQKLAGRVRVANALKQRYQAAMTTHARLLENLQEDGSWAWAKTELIEGKLREAGNGVRAAMDSTPFNSFFLMNNIAVVKAKHGDDLLLNLQQFVDIMEKPVAALEKEHEKMKKAHQVMAAA